MQANRRSVVALALALVAGALAVLGCAPRYASRDDVAKPDAITNLKTDICYLASDSLEGRLIGTPGIDKAAAYIAGEFKKAGLKPLFGDSYYQEFSVEFGFEVEGRPVFRIGDVTLDYSVLPLSGSGTVWAGAVIARAIPATEDVNLAGKVVFCLEDEAIDKVRWTMIGRDGMLEWMKGFALRAGELKAGAVIFVSGSSHNPAAGFHLFAVPRDYVASALPCLEITYSGLEKALTLAGGPSESSLRAIEGDSTKSWIEIPGLQCELGITTKPRPISVKNVGAVIRGSRPGNEYLVVGAHYDHLGSGDIASSTPWRREIHNGADDNASGVGAVLELARRVSSHGTPARSIAFVCFTAEELGAVGSEYFCKNPPYPIDSTIAMINLDTVGRLEANKLIVFGATSAAEFGGMLAKSDENVGLDLVEKQEIFGFSDQNPFYARHIPSLHLFTGANSDYHTPDDDCARLNFEGLNSITALTTAAVLNLANATQKITPIIVAEKESQGPPSRGRGGFLGIIPDFTYGGEGIQIKGSVAKSPAEAAGLQDGDVILSIDGQALSDLQQLMTVLNGKNPGDRITVEILRGSSTFATPITLSVRSPN